MPERQKDAESSACDSKNILLDDVGNCSYSQVRYRNFSFEQLIGFDYSTFSDRRLTGEYGVYNAWDNHIVDPLFGRIR